MGQPAAAAAAVDPAHRRYQNDVWNDAAVFDSCVAAVAGAGDGLFGVAVVDGGVADQVDGGDGRNGDAAAAAAGSDWK